MMTVVVVVGISTAFFAATVALVQNDIKRVIAYSTCSQLGYMFFAVGISAYPAAIFHLMTHAFFKALLFLGSGSVIHGMSDEQDMRKMGGIWKKMPFTYAIMWIGSLALAGIPPFAGYYSKDVILESAFAANLEWNVIFWAGISAALMTAFYSWRLIIMTFHGKPRASKEVMDHVHESPLVMVIPLGMLAIGAVIGGYIAAETFVGEHWKDFWGASHLFYTARISTRLLHDGPTTCPHGCKMMAIAVGRRRASLIAYLFYLVWVPGLPVIAARQLQGPLPVLPQQVVLRRALQPPVRAPGLRPRPRPLETGRRRPHRRRSAPTASPPRPTASRARVAALQSGLPLPLCLRRPDRRRGPRLALYASGQFG